MILSPPIVLGFVIGSLCGLIFFLIFGRGWARLFLYWGIGVLGLVVGQWLGDRVGLGLFMIGDVRPIEGVLFSWLSLFFTRGLTR
jgi:hypothetical protein